MASSSQRYVVIRSNEYRSDTSQERFEILYNETVLSMKMRFANITGKALSEIFFKYRDSDGMNDDRLLSSWDFSSGQCI